jgi:hypothetical protein
MLWQRGRSYAQDLRERVFAAFDSGLPVGQIAAMTASQHLVRLQGPFPSP